MKLKYFLLILIIISQGSISLSQTVFSTIPKQARSYQEFIPKSYDTLMIAKGDLNKDGKADIAMVLADTLERPENYDMFNVDSTNRLLVILFASSNGYTLAGTSDKAILCKSCGGTFGDPLMEISIEKAVLTIQHYGGSSWRWGYTHKFRYQNGIFFLIGESSDYYFTFGYCNELEENYGTKRFDINYLTGQYTSKEVSAEGCKLLKDKKGKVRVKPLVPLKKFSINN